MFMMFSILLLASSASAFTVTHLQPPKLATPPTARAFIRDSRDRQLLASAHRSPCRLHSARPPTVEGGGIHSFMDGDDMDSVEGIESLGGDPSFFLDPEEMAQVMKKTFEKEQEEEQTQPLADDWKLGDGPRPRGVSAQEENDDDDELWDGNPIEDAYFD